jgi:hypothetical protein
MAGITAFFEAQPASEDYARFILNQSIKFSHIQILQHYFNNKVFNLASNQQSGGPDLSIHVLSGRVPQLYC